MRSSLAYPEEANTLARSSTVRRHHDVHEREPGSEDMTPVCSSALHQRHTETEPLVRIEYELVDAHRLFGLVSLGTVVLVEDPIPIVAEPFTALVDIGDLPHQRSDLPRPTSRRTVREGTLATERGDELD